MPILSLTEVIEQLGSLNPPISAEIITPLENITPDSANSLRESFNKRRADPAFDTVAKALFYQAALAIAYVYPVNSTCPISQEELTEITEEEEGDGLVTTSDGYKFRLTAINQWVNVLGNETNPATNQIFSDEDIATIKDCARTKGLSVDLVRQPYEMSDTTQDAIAAAQRQGPIQPFIVPVVSAIPFPRLNYFSYRSIPFPRLHYPHIDQFQSQLEELRLQLQRREREQRSQLLETHNIRLLILYECIGAGTVVLLPISQLQILATDNITALILSEHLTVDTALDPRLQNKLAILDMRNIFLLIKHNYLTVEEAFELTTAQTQKIRNINIDLHHIYRAMCVGETNFHSVLRFFRIDKCFKITKELNTMTLEEILVHADANPTSRTAKALEIYKNQFLPGIMFRSQSLRTFGLFSAIHEHCSSSPFARTTNKLHQVPEGHDHYGKRSQDIKKIIEDNLLPQSGPAGS